jgi:hypothetical protein
MADTDADIEIPLDDPPKPEGDAGTIEIKTEEAPKTVVEPDEGLEVLKAKLAESERRAAEARAAQQAAEQRERERANEAARAKTEVQDTNVQLVTNAIETVKQSTEMLKAQYAEAMQAGDYGKVADIQVEMAKNASRQLTLENGLEQMKAAPKPQAAQIADPVEQFASQLTPRSAAWVREHPQYVTDPRLQQRMLAAHNLAVTDGVVVDSDDYFSAVERTLGLAQEEPGAQAAQVTQRRQSPPAAPVSRGQGGNGSAPTTIRLSAEEREMAAMMGQTEQEYARAKAALIKEGRLN